MYPPGYPLINLQYLVQISVSNVDDKGAFKGQQELDG